jgi:DNA-binding CsgD family transcriptional regulator
VIVIDDADLIDDERMTVVSDRLCGDVRTRIAVAAVGIPAELARMIDRFCDRRMIEVPALDAEESRELLAATGLEPWTIVAAQLLESCQGNPRELIDGCMGEWTADAFPTVDATFDPAAWSPLIAKRTELVLQDDSAELAQLQRQLDSLVGATDFDGADAAMVRSRNYLQLGDLEPAVQHGERAATLESATESVIVLGSAYAAAARALRGEPTAILSLHALAGRAARAGLPLVEAEMWRLIGWVTGNLGDVTTARRAMVRGIVLCDGSGALALGLQSRLAFADLLLATGGAAPARTYFREVAAVAEHRGLRKLWFDAVVGCARAHLAAGEIEMACARADEALEMAVREDVCRVGAVELAVVAARAYAAAGSVELALVPLDALASQLGDSHSPDFWLVLEAIRVLGKAGTDPAAFKVWLGKMAKFDADGHGGALRAAHAEADAWHVAIDGRKAEAARLAGRARQLWIEAECHDELPLSQPLIDGAPLEHGPRIQLVGTSNGVPGPAEDPEAFAVLTKREREIARYVAGGLTNPEIASELHLSPRTVEHHVASILRKLELPNRRALVRGRV